MFDQTSDQCWVTAVQVATVWTNPESAREIDQPAISNPTDIDQWIASQNYLRKVALCDENRVQTQLLYGEKVIVINERDGWCHIVIPTQPSHKDERGYPGWVPFQQLKKVSVQDWSSKRMITVTDKFAWLEKMSGERVLKISYQTRLPLKRDHGDRVEVVTPHGLLFLPKASVSKFLTAKGPRKQPGNKLIETAEQFIGLEYFWGGMSAFGFDCSGFTYVMHQANGYQIPRDAGDQAKQGVPIPFDRLLPGDLLFFAHKDGAGRIHHVGMYCGDGSMIHAPKTGKSIEMIKLEGTFYKRELCAARRYWQGADDDG